MIAGCPATTINRSTALAIVEARGRGSAHALKLQTYTADTMTIDVREANSSLPIRTACGRAVRCTSFTSRHTPRGSGTNRSSVRELGMIPFSTPFDETAVDFLNESLDVGVRLNCLVSRIPIFR